MAKNSLNRASPLTFDLPVSLIEKVAATQTKLGLASTSEVVRLAIAKFNFDRFAVSAEEHRQISVRLPSDIRMLLTKSSRKKKVSVGELLRVALDELEVAKPAKLPKAGKAEKSKAKSRKSKR